MQKSHIFNQLIIINVLLKTVLFSFSLRCFSYFLVFLSLEAFMFLSFPVLCQIVEGINATIGHHDREAGCDLLLNYIQSLKGFHCFLLIIYHSNVVKVQLFLAR